MTRISSEENGTDLNRHQDDVIIALSKQVIQWTLKGHRTGCLKIWRNEMWTAGVKYSWRKNRTRQSTVVLHICSSKAKSHEM